MPVSVHLATGQTLRSILMSLVILCLSAHAPRASAQGVEASPTGVDDMEPRRVTDDEAAEAYLAGLSEQFVGQRAPALRWRSLLTPDQAHRLSDQDRPFILYFWATWCPPCDPMHDALGSLREEVGSKVGFVALSDESRAALLEKGRERTVQRRPYIPVGQIEPSDSLAWKVEAYPLVFVVDAQKNVAGVFNARSPWSAVSTLVRSLAESTEARDPSKPALKP